MINYKYILLGLASFVLLLTTSCGSSKDANLKSRGKDDVMFIPSEDTIIIAEIGEVSRMNPQTEINAYRLEDNILYLQVTYSGGCKQQEFQIYGDTLIYEDGALPSRKITLYRDSKGDLCRELVTRELWFNLELLAPENKVGSRVVLLLEGIDDPLNYMLK